MTLVKMVLSIMKLIEMTLSIMTLSVMGLSIATFSKTLYAGCFYVERRVISVVMLSVASLYKLYHKHYDRHLTIVISDACTVSIIRVKMMPLGS
jgi:hypothetical protein